MKPKRFVIVSSPIRSRGCAEVSRDREDAPVILAFAAPNKFSLRRLARLFEHEVCGHAAGLEHSDMPEPLLYSEGPTPSWAEGLTFRYLGRAPRQMTRLKR